MFANTHIVQEFLFVFVFEFGTHALVCEYVDICVRVWFVCMYVHVCATVMWLPIAFTFSL